MDYSEKSADCIIAKCKIDAREITRSERSDIRGFYMCVISSREIEYEGVLFSYDVIDTEAPLSVLYSALEAPRQSDRPEELPRYESELRNFIRTSRIFQNEKTISDIKALEHKITYFCTSSLSLNAISFIELIDMSREELYLSIPFLERGGKPEDDEKQTETAEEPAKQDAAAPSGPPDVVVACDPVLEPVAGVAVNELSVGDKICCKLREGTVFHDLMAKATPDFDGIVSGDITAISINEIGSATVALKLSDGVTGALKLTGTVRIKVLSRQVAGETPAAVKTSFALNVTLAVAGIIVFIAAMWLLIRFFG